MQTPAECATGKAPTRRISDRELISRFLAARDESAFAELVTRYSRLVMSVALHTLRDPHAAEDAFQATFLVLAKSARRIRNRDSLASWLHGTTFRVSHRLLRTRKRRKEQDLSNVEPPAPWDPPARPDEQAALDEELARLSEGLRGLLVLHYLEGRTVPEIAAELKMTPSAVEGRLKRGKQTLRKRLLKRGVLLSSAIFGAGLTIPAEAGVATALVTATVAACLKTTAAATLAPIAATTIQQIALQEMAAMTRIAMMRTALVCCGAAGVIGLAGAAGNGMLGLASAGESQQSDSTPATGPSTASEPGASLPLVIQTASKQTPDKSPNVVIQTDGTTLTADRLDIGVSIPVTLKDRITAILQGTTEFHFTGLALDEAIAFFAEQHNIPIKFDQESARRAGVAHDAEVHYEATNKSLSEGLKQLLPSPLTYRVEDDGIHVLAAAPPAAAAPRTGVGSTDETVKVLQQQLAAKDQQIAALEKLVRATEARLDLLQAEVQLGSQERKAPVAPAPDNQALPRIDISNPRIDIAQPGTGFVTSFPTGVPVAGMPATASAESTSRPPSPINASTGAPYAGPAGLPYGPVNPMVTAMPGSPQPGGTVGIGPAMGGMAPSAGGRGMAMGAMPGGLPQANNSRDPKSEQIRALEEMVRALQAEVQQLRQGDAMEMGADMPGAPPKASPAAVPRPKTMNEALNTVERKIAKEFRDYVDHLEDLVLSMGPADGTQRPKVVDEVLKELSQKQAQELRAYVVHLEELVKAIEPPDGVLSPSNLRPGASLRGQGSGPSRTVTGLADRNFATRSDNSVHEFRTASKLEDNIRTSLAKAVDFQFTGQTLQEVMRYLETEYNITIRIDHTALTGAGVGPDQEINLVISGISLGAALNLMFKDVAGTQLDYFIEDEVMTVTTKEKADEALQTVIYDLSGLGPGVAEQINMILEKAVDPASWEPAGGKGTIIPVDNSVIITTSRRLHDKTAKIIQMLQQHAKATRPVR